MVWQGATCATGRDSRAYFADDGRPPPKSFAFSRPSVSLRCSAHRKATVCDLGELLMSVGQRWRLARVVVQMPPAFVRTPTNDASLRAFCDRWSGEFPLAIELRHVSWRRLAVVELLCAHNISMVGHDLRDVPGLDRASFDTST